MQHTLDAEMTGDGPLMWRVTSASRHGIEHLVDLGSWNGFGACSCEAFQFNQAAKLRHGEHPGSRCKHILRAREAFTDTMVASLASRENQKRNQYHNG